MPVVDDGVVVGMLSSADLMKLEGFLPRTGQAAIEYLNQHLRLESLVRRPPILVGPDESIGRAAELMATHGVHSLPVVDARGALLGIITTTDIMNAAVHPREPAGEADAPVPSKGGAYLPTAWAHALEAVLAAAERYLQSGMAARPHADLVRAIEHAREMQHRGGGPITAMGRL
jgi:CBS domain-containing protein